MMSQFFSTKKDKKDVSSRTITASEEVFRTFYLGDLMFTFLPVVIVIILKYSLGELGNIFFLPDWPFISIIISSWALIRFVELKAVYQKDTSVRSVTLTMLSIILVISSVVCLTLYTLKAQGEIVNGKFIIPLFQFCILITSVFCLRLAHYERERLLFAKREFPTDISVRKFDWYLSENLKDARKSIQVACAALNKEYDFFARESRSDNITDYEKQEMVRLIENMQSKLNELHRKMVGWDKPPYSKLAPPEIQDDSGLLRNSSQQE